MESTPLTAASAWQRSPRRRLRHGIRALPLPPARRINKIFCKSGLPQNHMPRPRQIKDLGRVEDLQRRIFFSLFFSYRHQIYAGVKMQVVDFAGVYVFSVGIGTILNDRSAAAALVFSHLLSMACTCFGVI
ncbi:hypothetical protein ACW5W8_01470 [Aeromonas aquatilis]